MSYFRIGNIFPLLWRKNISFIEERVFRKEKLSLFSESLVPSTLNCYVSIEVTGTKAFYFAFIMSIDKQCKFQLPLYFYTNKMPCLLSIPATVNL